MICSFVVCDSVFALNIEWGLIFYRQEENMICVFVVCDSVFALDIKWGFTFYQQEEHLIKKNCDSVMHAAQLVGFYLLATRGELD